MSNTVAYTLNTTAPTVSSIVTSGAGITNGNGDLNAGKVVTLDGQFQRGGDGQHRGRLAHARAQRWRDSASYIAVPALERADLQLHGGGRAKHLRLSSCPRFNPNGSDDPGRGDCNNADLSGATNDNPAGHLADRHHRSGRDDHQRGRPVNQATQTVTGTVPTRWRHAGTTVRCSTARPGRHGDGPRRQLVTNVALATAQHADRAGHRSGRQYRREHTVTYTLNTTAPTVSSIVTSGAGITNGVGDLNAGKVVTLDGQFQRGGDGQHRGRLADARAQRCGTRELQAVPARSALTFSYTWLPESQNTPPHRVLAAIRTGATIQDAACNNADLSGATNDNPAGLLQIDTTAPVVTITSTGGPATRRRRRSTGTVDMADAGTTVKAFDGTTQPRTTTVSTRQLEHQCRLGKRLQ